MTRLATFTSGAHSPTCSGCPACSEAMARLLHATSGVQFRAASTAQFRTTLPAAHRASLSDVDLRARLEALIRAEEPAFGYISGVFMAPPSTVVYGRSDGKLFGREFELTAAGTVSLVGKRQEVVLHTDFVAGSSADPETGYGAALAALRGEKVDAAVAREAAQLSRAAESRLEFAAMSMPAPQAKLHTSAVYLNPPNSYDLALAARKK